MLLALVYIALRFSRTWRGEGPIESVGAEAISFCGNRQSVTVQDPSVQGRRTGALGSGGHRRPLIADESSEAPVLLALVHVAPCFSRTWWRAPQRA